MLQAFRKILKSPNTLNHEVSSEKLLKCRPTKLAHNLSKDVRLQKARPLTARICLNDDLIKYKGI